MRLFNDFTAIRLNLFGNNIDQGGFTGTVAAYQTDTLARLNRHTDVVEDELIAEFEGNLTKSD